MGFFDKLKERVGKTRSNVSDKLNTVIKNFRRIDEDFFEELEEICTDLLAVADRLDSLSKGGPQDEP